VADPKPKIRKDRLVLAFVALVLASVLGIVGALNNWYAFALGEVSASPQPAAAAPTTPVSPGGTSASPSASPNTSEYKQGREDGAKDGFQAGRAEGRKIGEKNGEKRGSAIGKKDGYKAGYARGYSAGYAAGFKQGHACAIPKPFCSSISGG